MENKYYLAIDIGASSGRHIVGWKDDGVIITKEIYRFDNHVDKVSGHIVWDTKRLFNEVKQGLKVAFLQYKEIESIAIDTWGVDYVLLKDGKVIEPCYAYRDNRTEHIINAFHNNVSMESLYSRTGIQFQPFNTIYQLMEDVDSGRLDGVDTFLMLPEYLSFLLTGNIVKEYTNATTTGLVNCNSKEFDIDLINTIGLPAKLFGKLQAPGTVVGKLSNDIAKEVGGNTTVKLCPSHDTASAFYAVDTQENDVIISSGTWALVGTKIQQANISNDAMHCNFTNEGGVGNIRFLKNVTGMWINVCLQKEYGRTFDEMTAMAKESHFEGVFDVNDTRFSLPENMSAKIRNWFIEQRETAPENDADLYRCVYRSMAMSYKNAIDEMQLCLNKVFERIVIVGGGANNKLVNSFTQELTGKEVIALPIEATAIGNIKSQMEL